jgi:uncharacterized protein (TIGR00730 family)
MLESASDIKRVCVYCASSSQVDDAYYDAAYRLGQILAQASITIVYGGGGLGSMGRLADGALEEGGKVIGVLPRFMRDLEWNHPHLTELQLVDDLRERKHLMLDGSDAVVTLPGGCGTLEELLEAVTLKRLGIYLNPIVLVNTLAFFDPLIAQLETSISERFMDARHGSMWTVVPEPEQVLDGIRDAPGWSGEARAFAAV